MPGRCTGDAVSHTGPDRRSARFDRIRSALSVARSGAETSAPANFTAVTRRDPRLVGPDAAATSSKIKSPTMTVLVIDPLEVVRSASEPPDRYPVPHAANPVPRSDRGIGPVVRPVNTSRTVRSNIRAGTVRRTSRDEPVSRRRHPQLNPVAIKQLQSMGLQRCPFKNVPFVLPSSRGKANRESIQMKA
jgi:hypothetical protein